MSLLKWAAVPIIGTIGVVAIGSFLSGPESASRTPECHSSYSECLDPRASDYDCAGGSGNGPYYTGKVRVYGYDEYGLDRDGNGWGCE